MSTGRQTIAAVETIVWLAAARPSGGRTAQIFGDCAITKYLSLAASTHRSPAE